MINFSHGGDIYSRKVDYDFSANINPLGMPESVKRILARKINDFEHYPDPNCFALVKEIALYEGVGVNRIVCGNGADDLIYRIVQALNPKNTLIAIPTFSEYKKALRTAGCSVNYHQLKENYEFEVREDIIEKIDGNDMMFLCNPNNPTGKMIASELMEKIIKKCNETGCLLILDECFMDFAEEKARFNLKPNWKNVLVLKAFTKIYAMAGLRLGYVICPDLKIADKIRSFGQCWSVSVPAQLAGETAIKEREYVSETVRLIAEERAFLSEKLHDFGFKVYESAVNFILFRCSLPLDRLLLEKKRIAVRRCDNFAGLEAGFFRIAVRTHEENEILINAIEEVLENG
ncbi:MAG: aminotransferase class I/II-fold pyridoxal phosphate-dependent enzyme [Ruminococcus flavefaciens]|nr:aminotransferase class I/II-fold pyridoxal phosphate-dependent enzyme [Ruminococcus flavefaciens]MCM1059946.1 aminotransferase class I/II-fold pyridoxal phosphate-dependent enzyme [Eubacterium sp.]